MTKPNIGMTSAELEEIMQAEQAATPGPWKTGYTFHGKYPVVFADKIQEPIASKIKSCSAYDRPHNKPGDAQFIAVSRTAVPKLLAEVDRLKEIVADAKETIEALTSCLNCEYACINKTENCTEDREECRGFKWTEANLDA